MIKIFTFFTVIFKNSGFFILIKIIKILNTWEITILLCFEAQDGKYYFKFGPRTKMAILVIGQ